MEFGGKYISVFSRLYWCTLQLCQKDIRFLYAKAQRRLHPADAPRSNSYAAPQVTSHAPTRLRPSESPCDLVPLLRWKGHRSLLCVMWRCVQFLFVTTLTVQNVACMHACKHARRHCCDNKARYVLSQENYTPNNPTQYLFACLGRSYNRPLFAKKSKSKRHCDRF